MDAEETLGSSPVGGHHQHLGGSGRALVITSWLTGIYFVIELGLGIYTGSIAVISDALHTFSAVGGILLAIVARKIAVRPADHYRTFGYKRAEIVGALANGIFLLAMAAVVIFMGYRRVLDPMELPTTPMLIAAAGGLITEAISIRLLYQSQKSDLNVKGAFWHVLQTFVGSLIIIVSALVIRFTGYLEIDPILGMAFGVVLVWASWVIVRDATVILMETVPREVNLTRITEQLAAIPGVTNVHHIHAWVITSGTNLFSTHLLIDDSARAQSVLARSQEILDESGSFYFSTIQTETRCVESRGADDIDITQFVSSSGPAGHEAHTPVREVGHSQHDSHTTDPKA